LRETGAEYLRENRNYFPLDPPLDPYTDDERLAAAHAFFTANRAAMLAGTEVLWPEGEPYLELMRHRIDDGPLTFQSEKQNEPLDPSQCKFPEAWFQWFDEVEEQGEAWLVPEHGDRIKLADCDLYGACDPSKGRADKGGDREYWVSARTAKMLERIARAEHDLAAVTIGTLTVKFHYQTVRTCDVTKSLGL